MFVRHMARAFDALPTGGELNVAEVARSLGLGERSGRNGPFLRTVARSVDFDMASIIGPGRLAVRRLLPTLSARQIARLSPRLATEHQRAIARGDGAPDSATEQCRRLALSLLVLGEEVADTERQLTRWHFHPALAAQCAAWASAQRQTQHDDGRIGALGVVSSGGTDALAGPRAIGEARRVLGAMAQIGPARSEVP
jgi:hypothetical protein